MKVFFITLVIFLVALQVATAQGNDIVWMKGGHAEAVLCAAVSPDGTMLASGSEDRKIRLWDIATGNLVSTISGHTSDVTALAFMPDGTLISGGKDSTVRFWNAGTWQQQRVIKEKAAVFQLGCSPDGLRLITAYTDGKIAIGDLTADSTIAVFTAYMFALSSDGLMIASGSADTVQLRDATNGALLSQIPLHGSFIAALAFSPDRKFIAIGERHEFYQDDTVQVRDIATGAVESVLATPEDDRSDPLAMAFISGDTLAVASSHFLQAWDVGDTQRLWSTQIDLQDIIGQPKVGLLPVHSTILLFGERIQPAAPGNIYLPMLEMRLFATGQVILNYVPYLGSVTKLVFASARRALVTTGWDRFVQWSFPEGTLEYISQYDNRNEQLSLGISPDGGALAKFSYNLEHAGSGRIVMYGPAGTNVLVEDRQDDIRFVVPGPNGQFCGYQTDRNFILWSAATGTKREIAVKALGARFSSNGERLAILAEDRSLVVWNIRLDTIEWSLPHDSSRGYGFCISHDGNLLATNHLNDGGVTVWELSSRSSIQQLSGHRRQVNDLAFARGGRYLVTAGADSTIRTWVLATGANDYTYTSYPAAHISVAVSADAKYIASSTADGALILWNARGAIASVESQKNVAGSSALRCYPTPASSLVTIECELARPGDVDVRIVDQLGREVAQLADGELESGTHRFTWDAEALPAGIYHCRLQTASEHIARQIVVVR